MQSAQQRKFGFERSIRRGTVAKALLILIPALVIVAAMGYFAIRLATETPEEQSSGLEMSGAELEQNLAMIRQSVETYFLQDNLDAADTILAASLKKLPNNQDLRLLNAELRMMQQRPEEAYEEMKKASTIGPDNPEYRYAAAGYAKAAGLSEDAMYEVRKAITMSETPDIRFFVFLGALQMQQQQLADAQATLLIALQQDPEQPTIYAMLAEIDLQQGGSEKGLEFARKARELNPNQFAFRITEARLLRRLGRLEDSLDVLTTIDEYTRLTNAAVLRDVVITLQALEQKDRAADFAARAAEASPTDAQVIMIAADAMDMAGRLQEAVDLATRARMLGHPNGQARVEHLQRKLAEASSERG